MMILRFKGFVVASMILFFSCQPSSREINPKTLDVFRDFALVGHGSAKFENDGSLDVTYIVVHNDEEQPHPEQLQTRVQYVFHNRRPVNDEQLGLEVLPSRLRELGFKVLEGPKLNGGQFSYPYMGGPYFSITFVDGDHKGVIFNRVDGKIANEKWVVDDYVLVFLS